MEKLNLENVKAESMDEYDREAYGSKTSDTVREV